MRGWYGNHFVSLHMNLYTIYTYIQLCSRICFRRLYLYGCCVKESTQGHRHKKQWQSNAKKMPSLYKASPILVIFSAPDKQNNGKKQGWVFKVDGHKPIKTIAVTSWFSYVKLYKTMEFVLNVSVYKWSSLGKDST